MFKKLISLPLCIALILCASISSAQVDSPTPYSTGKSRLKLHSTKQLNSPEYTICVMKSTHTEKIANTVFPRAKKIYFDGGAAVGVMKVLNREADAFLFDSPTLDYVASYNKNLVVLPQTVGEGHIGIAAPKRNEALIQEVNQFITQYRTNGVYQSMYYRWFIKSGSVLPSIPKPAAPTRKVIVGTEGTQVPFNFMSAQGVPMQRGFLTGFDVELIQRMALAMNWDVEWRMYSWDDLITATKIGQIDLMISELESTPERQAELSMSIPYVDSHFALLVRKDKVNADLLREIEQRRQQMSFGFEKEN
ncbi:MAG: transporter substrate-binding domain-containing protein [Thermoguttaceae bacterium]|nr:transporter substrate-binding domain-containing protein [Thermoguttaceae bacterium]